MLQGGFEQLDFVDNEFLRLKKDVNGIFRFTNKVKVQ